MKDLDNTTIQNSSQIYINFELEARKLALTIARDMKPPPVYSTQLGGPPPVHPYYDILKEAESIYQWLIKPYKIPNE